MNNGSFKTHTACISYNTEKTIENKIIISNQPTDNLHYFKDISNENKKCKHVGLNTTNLTYLLGRYIFKELSISYCVQSHDNWNIGVSLTLTPIPK